MLRLDLAQLARAGSAQLETSVPAGDSLWEDSEVAFAGPVEVHLRAAYAGSGEVVVRGWLGADLRQECRRCLEPVAGRLETEVTMTFIPGDVAGTEEDDEVRLFDPGQGEIDLREPVREEVILAIDPYVVCSPECKGLCPQCGTNLNEGSCDCTWKEPDPRWDVLRNLREE